MEKAKSFREEQVQHVIHSLEMFDKDLAHQVISDLQLTTDTPIPPQRARASSLPNIYGRGSIKNVSSNSNIISDDAALKLQCAWRGRLARRRSLDALWTVYEAQEKEMEHRRNLQVKQGLVMLQMEQKRREASDAKILQRDKLFVRVHAAVRIQRVFKERGKRAALTLKERRVREEGKKKMFGGEETKVGREVKSKAHQQQQQQMRQEIDDLSLSLVQELERRNTLTEEKVILERSLEQLVSCVGTSARARADKKSVLGLELGSGGAGLNSISSDFVSRRPNSPAKSARATVMSVDDAEDRLRGQ